MLHRIYSIIKTVLDLGCQGRFNQISSNVIISNNNKSLCCQGPCFLPSWMDGWMDGWKMDMWVDKWMSIWMAQGVEPSSNNCRVRGSNTSCCSLHLVLVKDTEPQTVLSGSYICVWFEWMIIDEQLAPCITMSSILKFMFLSVQPFLFCFLLWCLTLLFFQSPLSVPHYCDCLIQQNLPIVLLVFQCFNNVTVKWPHE